MSDHLVQCLCDWQRRCPTPEDAATWISLHQGDPPIEKIHSVIWVDEVPPLPPLLPWPETVEALLVELGFYELYPEADHVT